MKSSHDETSNQEAPQGTSMHPRTPVVVVPVWAQRHQPTLQAGQGGVKGCFPGEEEQRIASEAEGAPPAYKHRRRARGVVAATCRK